MNKQDERQFDETQRFAGNLIVFDSVCLVCSGFARFIAQHDRHAGFRFVDANSEAGRRIYLDHDLDPDLMETNIVVLNGRSYTRMASLTAAVGALGGPWRLVSILNLIPGFLSDRLYNLIARNRYRLGKRSCALPSKELRDRILE